jgi:hypothetical protein
MWEAAYHLAAAPSCIRASRSCIQSAWSEVSAELGGSQAHLVSEGFCQVALVREACGQGYLDERSVRGGELVTDEVEAQLPDVVAHSTVELWRNKGQASGEA